MGVHVGPGVVVVMNPAPLVYVQLFHSGSGPDRHLRQKTAEVAALAYVLAPKVTWHLARSIKFEQNRTERGHFTFGYTVAANARYSAAVHEGARPHRVGKYPGAMRFRGTNGHVGRKGGYIFTDDVRHPGNRDNPFLMEALSALGM